MAAFDDAPRQMGQIPHHRQTGLGFQHWTQRFVQGFRAIVKQNAHDMVGRAELQKPPQLGGKGDACPFWLHYQQHRQRQRIGQLPSACTGCQSLPVVKAHGTLAYGSAVPGGIPGVKRAHRIRGREVEV